MPTLSPPAHVIVTGANGYLGLSIVRALLARGYSVRAAVRSPSAAQTILDVVARKHPLQAENLTVVIIPDISAEGAFDHVLQGVSGIIHTATLVTFDEVDPDAYLKPAVRGTTGMLQSALKHGRDVRRVVVTSSVAAIAATEAPDGIYAEDVWNDEAVRAVEEHGAAAHGSSKYLASKTLGERAAWAFMSEHANEATFDLCTILPSYCMGRLPDDPSSPSELRSTNRLIYSQLFSPSHPSPRQPPCFNYIDTRDVVELHIRALEVEAAGGERISATSHVCSWQDWVDAAKALRVLPRLDGEPPETAILPPHPTYSNEKAKRIFGIKFRTVPETFREVYEDFSARGWLKHLEE